MQKLDATIADATAAKADGDYVTAAATAGAKIDTVSNVIRLAANKEMIAAQTYASVAPNFTIADNMKFSIDHAGDEAAHFGVLRAAAFALYNDTGLIATADKTVPSSLLSGFTSPITGA